MFEISAPVNSRACFWQDEYRNGLAGIIFDCDGVLFDSKGANSAYYNHIRAAVGLPPMNAEEAAYAHMATVQEALERMIPEHLKQAAREVTVATVYREHFMGMMMPEPYLHAFLHNMRNHGVRLAMCTNRSASVSHVLERFELDGIFDPIMTVSNAVPKPDPDGLLQILKAWGVSACDTAFVGDSQVDQMAAQGAGVPFWSFQNQELTARLHVESFTMLDEMISPLLSNNALLAKKESFSS